MALKPSSVPGSVPTKVHNDNDTFSPGTSCDGEWFGDSSGSYDDRLFIVLSHNTALYGRGKKGFVVD